LQYLSNAAALYTQIQVQQGGGGGGGGGVAAERGAARISPICSR